jgi:hypothetical protein
MNSRLVVSLTLPEKRERREKVRSRGQILKIEINSESEAQ